MRIKIKGRQSLSEFVRKVNVLADELSATGVTELASVDLRFEPYAGDRPAKLRGPGGEAADVAQVSADGTRVYSLVELRDLRAEGQP